MEEIATQTATVADVDSVAAMLARAFDDDPVLRFMIASRWRRDRYAQRFFGWQLRRTLSGEQVHVSRAGAGAGAAIWALPNRWRETTVEGLSLAVRMLPAVALHVPRVTASIAMLERRHPREPHMYLSVLGTEPSAQGCGLGSAAIAPGLAFADAEGLPAFLESSKERNLDFYARFGFRVMGELHLPGGGPPMWPMWREPGSGRS
jgi:GNAT superfamily N-acetyltransferase